MEREILFRGKRVDNGEWIEGSLLNFRENSYIIPHDSEYCYDQHEKLAFDVEYFEVIPETVGQYTGLTDKNGVKIFEGDCLRSIKESSFSIVQHGLFIPQFFYECVYEAKGFNLHNKVFGFYCENPITKEQFFLTDYVSDICVVIGNVFDNPELMKGESNV